LDFSISTSSGVAVDDVGDAFVVVVDGHGQGLFRGVLADAVLVEVGFEFLRRGDVARELRREFLVALDEDLAADLHAGVADEDVGRAGDEAPGHVAGLAAERTGPVKIVSRPQTSHSPLPPLGFF